jgi:lipopolysaccharide/colanic/teichoic acid biosynthesis glycosyltransferase
MAVPSAAESPSIYAVTPSVLKNQTDFAATTAYGTVLVVPVSYARSKRALDLVISTIALIAMAPVLAIVALVVRVTSPGPVIFRQTRVGRGGKHFTLYKFRTMHVYAEQVRESILHLNEISGPVFKVKNDPRVTPVGRILRKFSIDELPQLFNVLRGDMTLVGPRPPLPCEVMLYGPHEKRRLAVDQGLTCLWQIHGRHDIPFERWVELDITYIKTMSFWGDLALLVKTIPAVITAKGSY